MILKGGWIRHVMMFYLAKEHFKEYSREGYCAYI